MSGTDDEFLLPFLEAAVVAVFVEADPGTTELEVADDENFSCIDRESLQNLALSRNNLTVRMYVFNMTTIGRKKAAVDPVTRRKHSRTRQIRSSLVHRFEHAGRQ